MGEHQKKKNNKKNTSFGGFPGNLFFLREILYEINPKINVRGGAYELR